MFNNQTLGSDRRFSFPQKHENLETALYI